MTPMQQTNLYMRACPRCKTQIPDQIIICWNCGYCLDPHLIELAKPAKEAKP